MRIEGPFFPPFAEICPPDYGGIIYFPPLDYVLHGGLSGGGGVGGTADFPAYGNQEGRLINSLRRCAQLLDPVAILAEAVKTHYIAANSRERELARAFTDLAVTGRTSFSALMAIDEEVLQTRVRSAAQVLIMSDATELDSSLLDNALNRVFDRMFAALWVLRGPTSHRLERRAELGWLAVSGEDDSPHRPVNVGSGAWPQVDITLTVQGIEVTLRVMIASMRADYEPAQPFNSRGYPVDMEPFVPNEEELILFIHGHSSRAEEASDLIPQLHTLARQRGRRVCVISFDLPGSGYSQLLEHNDVGHIDRVSRRNDIFPILTFYENTIMALVDYLDAINPVKDRIAAIIGGSLGGNMGLRFLEKRPLPDWLQAVVSWSAASVWESFEGSFDLFKSAALGTLEGKSQEEEYYGLRKAYFSDVFDGNQNFLGIEIVPPQPEMWYRDDWECKAISIANSRVERQEIYNPLFRKWHWRVAYEQLVFSHLNAIPSSGGVPYYRRIFSPLLLLAGQQDNYAFARIHDATRDMARRINAFEPSKGLFLRDTGHSIHSERPRYLATEIFNFLAGVRTACGRPSRLANLDLGPLRVVTEINARRNPIPYMWCGVITVNGRRLRQDEENPDRFAGEPEYLFATGTYTRLGSGNSYPGAEIDVPATIGGPARSTKLEPIPIFIGTGLTVLFPAIYINVLTLVAPTGGADTAISAHQLFNFLLRQRFNDFIANFSLYRVWEEALTRSSGESSLQDAIDQIVATQLSDLSRQWNSNGENSLTALMGSVRNNDDELIAVRAIIKTEKELVESGYSYPFTNEEGRFQNARRHYQLSGNIQISRPAVPIDCVPTDRRLRVTAINTQRRGSDEARTETDVIIHFGGISAMEQPWIFTKSRAVSLVLEGEKEFYVLQDDGDETPLILGLHPVSRNYYLRTVPNETEDDNLLSLPDIDFYFGV